MAVRGQFLGSGTLLAVRETFVGSSRAVCWLRGKFVSILWAFCWQVREKFAATREIVLGSS